MPPGQPTRTKAAAERRSAFSVFFAAISPRYRLAKLFLLFAVKMYVAKATLQTGVEAKTAFPATGNEYEQPRNTRKNLAASKSKRTIA